jgi:CO/xanthine dehydrogenase Mo-binding subunit
MIAKQDFIADILPEDCLYGLTLRSEIAMGHILSIKVPELPPGYKAVTAADIPGVNYLQCPGRMPYLAYKKVNFIGEPFMLMAGEDQAVLRELLKLIEVEYREEEPFYLEGMKDRDDKRCRVLKRLSFSRGKINESLKNAYQIVEADYRTAVQEHFYADTQGAVALWDGKSLIVHSSTQDPFVLRDNIAGLLALNPRRVRVITPPLGCSLDGKLEPSFMLGGHAALLSYAAAKPVKMIYSREEDIACTYKSQGSWISHRTALDQEGNPLGMQVEITLDAGAYQLNSAHGLLKAAFSACGGYNCPNLEVKAQLIRSNRVPAGIFPGFGEAQSFFAVELQAARLAEIAHEDPVQWKRRNLLKRGDNLPTKGKVREDAGGLPVLEKVVAVSDFNRKHAAYNALKNRRESILNTRNPLRGIGLAVCSKGIGYQGEEHGNKGCTVKARLELDRRLTILTSIVDNELESSRIFKQIAARILDIEPEKITVAPVDTANVPNSGAASAVRTLTVIFRLLEKCCLAIKKKRLTSSLPIEVRKSYKVPEEPGWDLESRKGSPYREYSWAATVLELEIDPVTLQPNCRGIWLAIDSGSIVDLLTEKLALRMVKGMVIRALGYAAAAEHEPADILHILCPEEQYAVPGLMNLPLIRIDFIGRGEARGIGDLPFSGVAPAYGAAVSQATGYYIDQMPLSPEIIQKYML